jgi:hypothetical protein
MADAVFATDLVQNSGSAGLVYSQGQNPSKLMWGALNTTGEYTTGGIPVPADVTTFYAKGGGSGLDQMIFGMKNGYMPEFVKATSKIKIMVPASVGEQEVEEEAIAAPSHQRIYHGAVGAPGAFGNEIIRGGTSNATARVTAHPAGYLDITDIGLDGVYFLTGELVTDYNAHCADAVSHLAADTANDGAALPTANSWAAIYVALNALKTAYNTHDAESGTYHPAAGTAHQITSADATTPASASTLANELKSDFTAHIAEDSGCYTLLNDLIINYAAHCALVTDSVHNAADVVNNNPTALASHALADLIITANNLKAKFNAHDAETGTYHDAAGVAHQVSSADATNLASLITLLNEIKGDYTDHIAGVDTHSVADVTNVITAADSASAAHVQADAVNTIASSATGVTLQTAEVLTGLSTGATATSSTIAIDVWDLANSPALVQNVLNNSNAVLIIDSPSVTLATGHARVDLTNAEIETLLSDAYTALKVTYLKDAKASVASGAGGTVAVEVAAGTDLSSLDGIPFVAFGI